MAADSNIEQEIRGKFSDAKQLRSFVKKMHSVGDLKKYRHRFSVLFTNKNEEGVDLQIRDYGPNIQVMLKIGEHTATERQEYSIDLESSSFNDAVRLFYNLGFNKGVVADAEDWLFTISNDYEVKITICDDIILCWEIEALTAKKNIELHDLAKQLNLMPMSQSEIADYWRWMKESANKKFEIDTVFILHQQYRQNLENKADKQ